jgi:ABC-type cobalamin transport system ATPase subunit
VLVRCLTAWWRVERQPRLQPFVPNVLAAALVHLVGPIAGVRRTRIATAAVYTVAPLEVSRAARELQTLLQLSDLRAW